MRQHAGRLRKAQSLTLEVKGELAARQGGSAASSSSTWILGQATGTGSAAIATFRGDGTGAASRRHLHGSAQLVTRL